MNGQKIAKFPEEISIRMHACHQIPERCLTIRGKQMPLCARCFGVLLGNLTMPLFLFDIVHLGWLLTALFILPGYIDGITQFLFKRKSNNTLRLISGILMGVGLVSLGVLTADLILKLFKN